MNEEMKELFDELQEIKHKVEKMEHKFQKMGMRGGNYGMRTSMNGGYNQGQMGQAGGVFWGNQNPMMGGNQMPMGDMNMNNGNQNSWLDPRFI